MDSVTHIGVSTNGTWDSNLEVWLIDGSLYLSRYDGLDDHDTVTLVGAKDERVISGAEWQALVDRTPKRSAGLEVGGIAITVNT